MEEFIIPSFLEGESAEQILERMLSRLPEDLDVSEGNHIYNLLMPTAVEKERFVCFILQEAIKLIFPKYCGGYDQIVDYHAQTCGLRRKAPFYATAAVTVTGEPGTVLPVGMRVSTASVNETPAVDFANLEEAVISEDETCVITVQSIEPGIIGNVAAGAILFSDGSVDGIAAVTNKEAAQGGVEEESTESLIQRIAEYEANQGLSFIGCKADYKRWAEEVDGAGSAVVIPPKDDSGVIRIILTDYAGSPATESLCRAVYEHIMQTENPNDRKATINAKLVVLPPELVPVAIAAEVELGRDYTVDMIKTAFLNNLQAYLKEVPGDGEFRYSKAYSVLSHTEGVEDIGAFTMNEAMENIPVQQNEFPSVTAESVQLVAVTVG